MFLDRTFWSPTGQMFLDRTFWSPTGQMFLDRKFRWLFLVIKISMWLIVWYTKDMDYPDYCGYHKKYTVSNVASIAPIIKNKIVFIDFRLPLILIYTPISVELQELDSQT
jgi:hypothetical protein